MVNLHSAHMDPDDWHQPQQFRPERFLDESGNVIDKDRIIPFSLGIRSLLLTFYGEIFFGLLVLCIHLVDRSPTVMVILPHETPLRVHFGGFPALVGLEENL